MKHAPALILVGPSGVGKNTVASALLGAQDSPFAFVRSVTTRAPRATYAEEYLYVSEKEFLSLSKAGKLLEQTAYGDALYGTPVSEVLRVRAEGKIPLMILDISGICSIRRDRPDFPIFAVYLYADPIEIRRRLEARDLLDGGEKQRGKILARLENNREDFRLLAEGQLRLFDAFVENHIVADAARLSLKLYEERACADEKEMLRMRDFFLHAAEV